jgi:energy-coupling factor transport system ATP-binding protein
MSLTAIKGENFSGRTKLLRTEAAEIPGAPAGVYIGPEIYNYLSALCGDVESELRLHAVDDERLRHVRPLLEGLELPPLFQRNPFTLSGGQQAAVALASAAAMRRPKACVDSCLEQLDHQHRTNFLRWAANDDATWLIADNRFEEFEAEMPWTDRREMVAETRPSGEPHLRPLDVSACCAWPELPPAALELDDLGFEYRRGETVLQSISIELQPGLYVLNGVNGSGKTTLAKLLCGVLRPTSGRIRSGGKDCQFWQSPGHAVAYHFQNPDLQLFAQAVRAEVSLGGKRLAAADVQALMAAFGLQEVLGRHPLDLPFVGRKRVALAATLAMSTPWLILDEPTLGQDAATMGAIAALIDGLVSAGRGVIVISHSVAFRRRLNATSITLRDGHARYADY